MDWSLALVENFDITCGHGRPPGRASLRLRARRGWVVGGRGGGGGLEGNSASFECFRDIKQSSSEEFRRTLNGWIGNLIVEAATVLALPSVNFHVLVVPCGAPPHREITTINQVSELKGRDAAERIECYSTDR